MSAVDAYEKAKAEAVAGIILQLRQNQARFISARLGGTPEQQEETYQKLMELQAPAPD